MNRFFLNAMLVADLGTGTFQRLPLPEKALASGDLSVLAELFPKDVVIDLAEKRYGKNEKLDAARKWVQENRKDTCLSA